RWVLLGTRDKEFRDKEFRVRGFYKFVVLGEMEKRNTLNMPQMRAIYKHMTHQ
ncbi:hypothetical protein PanWU01x14_312770, partial [Parasponia andersonii]